MRGGRIATAGLVILGGMLAPTASAGASDGTFDRTWGKAVNATTSGDVCTAASGNTCAAGSIGTLGGHFNFPDGVAVDASGNIYVTDFNNDRVQKFDSSGNFLRTWGKGVAGGAGAEICVSSCIDGQPGSLGGEMQGPAGIAVDPGGVYVAEVLNHRIQKFDFSGNFINAWGKNVNGGGGYGICLLAANCQQGTMGSLGGEFNNPFGVATDDGEVYVTDYSNHRVQRFNFQGAFNRAWGRNVTGTGNFGVCTAPLSCLAGTTGTLGGEMNLPQGIAAHPSGFVYVSEVSGHRIQRFGASGGWDRAWGKNVNNGGVFGVCTNAASCGAGVAGSLAGELFTPRGLATDASGNVYVADATNRRIQKFGPTGTWQRAWGKGVNGGSGFGICAVSSSCLPGSTGGLAGELNEPGMMATDASGALYVADGSNHRVQRFGDAAAATPAPPAAGPTGRRAAALKKCKKIKSTKKRKKCKRKANKLPI